MPRIKPLETTVNAVSENNHVTRITAAVANLLADRLRIVTVIIELLATDTASVMLRMRMGMGVHGNIPLRLLRLVNHIVPLFLRSWRVRKLYIVNSTLLSYALVI